MTTKSLAPFFFAAALLAACSAPADPNIAVVSIGQTETAAGTTVRAAWEISAYRDGDPHETKVSPSCSFVRFDLRPDERHVPGVFAGARFSGALLPREGIFVGEANTVDQQVGRDGRGWNGGETLVAGIDGFGLVSHQVPLVAPSRLEVTNPPFPADESVDVLVKRGGGDLPIRWKSDAGDDTVEVRFAVSREGIEAAVVCDFPARANEGYVSDRALAMLPVTDDAVATFSIRSERRVRVHESDWYVFVVAMNQPVRRSFRWQ